MSVSSCSLTAGEVGAHRTYWKGRIMFSFSEGRLDSSCLKMGSARTSLQDRRQKHISHISSHVLSITRWTQITPLRPLRSTMSYLQTHDKNKSNRLTTPIIIKHPTIIGHTVSELCASYWGCYGNSNKCQSIHWGSHCSFQLKNFSKNMAWVLQ